MGQNPQKPKGLSDQYALQFCDPSVVSAYQFRPPHPDETIRFLKTLIPPSCRRVLDVGCGTGFIARPLARFAEQVDAVDCSQGMITTAKALCDASCTNIHWICGKVEDAPLSPPYGLITAGDSLHWMDWDVVMPRFAAALAPDAYLAIVLSQEEFVPWGDELSRLIPQYSTNRDFEPYDLIDELVRRDLVRLRGGHRSKSVPFVQPLDDYIESIHARNGFSRDRMPADAAKEFDQGVRKLLEKHHESPTVKFPTYSEVIWGEPLTR